MTIGFVQMVKGEKMPTYNIGNIKDMIEGKIGKLVDLSDDSINKIAESVSRKIEIGGLEVVRCNDCKWWNSDEETCIENGGLWRASDFCSWAERR